MTRQKIKKVQCESGAIRLEEGERRRNACVMEWRLSAGAQLGDALSDAAIFSLKDYRVKIVGQRNRRPQERHRYCEAEDFARKLAAVLGG